MLVEQVLSNAQRVNSASLERAAFVDNLTERSQSIGEDIGSLRAQNENARDALNSASQATNNMSNEVDGIVETLDNALKQIEDLSSRLAQFQSRFAEVESVSKAIQQVASRTNILSINALIEAGRAGVHGHGFGVVAQEVRELANLTSDSANSISSTISELTNDVGSLVSSCSSLESRMISSTESGKKSIEVLKTVDRSLDESLTLADSTYAASSAHLEQLSEITDGMGKLKNDTIAAIEGSAENIQISRELQGCIDEMRAAWKKGDQHAGSVTSDTEVTESIRAA